MGAERRDERGWLAYSAPAVAQGEVLRVVDGQDARAGETRITRVEIFKDAVRVSWCDREPPPRDEPVGIGERDHPQWRVADCGGAHLVNAGGCLRRETVDGRSVEHGHCLAAARAPHAVTEVRLTDGARTMALRLAW